MMWDEGKVVEMPHISTHADFDDLHVEHEDDDEEEGFDPTSFNKDVSISVAVMTATERIAQREARFVRCLQLGLSLVLLTASAIATANVYISLAEQEQSEFEEAFIDYSTKLTDEFQSVAILCIGAIGAFSATITSNTASSNVMWPFVTIPNFESQAQ